jgi:Flp pilus assembly protein CpaB
MLDVGWRLGFTVAMLVALAALGLCFTLGAGNRLIEQVTGQTPQARIAAYLEAIGKGDQQTALDLWSPAGPDSPELEARRRVVTAALLAYGPGLAYQVLDVEWWRTCCEPGVIEDASDAGGARVRVRLHGGNLPARVYVFDLLVPGGYWGEAMGNPLRTWAIFDVYPEGQAPLVWTW